MVASYSRPILYLLVSHAGNDRCYQYTPSASSSAILGRNSSPEWGGQHRSPFLAEMSHRERQTCAPESVTPRKMGFGIWRGQARRYLAPALLPGRLFQHVSCLDKPSLCLCEAAPAISCPPAPRGFQQTCREPLRTLLSARRWLQQVLAAGNQEDLNHACNDPRERGVKAGWFHGQKERPRACRRQDKSRERPTGWQAGPTNRAPTPKHSLSAPSFAGER